jgi:hypothetical protein
MWAVLSVLYAFSMAMVNIEEAGTSTVLLKLASIALMFAGAVLIT